MTKYIILIILLCPLVMQARASEPSAGVAWERDAALAAINANRIDIAAAEIGDISSLADARTTLEKLTALENRADWPLPAREAALYQFTRSLAGLPRDVVAAEVMQYLHRYQARTLVPHPDQPGAYVPLFNIRGAVSGVESGWSRTEATVQAAHLLDSGPAALLDAYLQTTNEPQRFGYLDAMKLAQPADVLAVQDSALQRLADEPGLTPLVIATSTITRDLYAMQAVLVKGRGAGLAPALTRFEHGLGDAELANLLGFAINQAPTVNAALAIAAWWPRLRHDAATRDLLVGLLANAELGSSAVLALSQAPDVQTIKLLQDTAAGDLPAARRAQQALDLNRAQLSGERQP